MHPKINLVILNILFRAENGKIIVDDFTSGKFEIYEILQVFEYTSERRKMSVLVKNIEEKDHNVILFAKVKLTN